MEKQIKKAARMLNAGYALVWLLPLLLVVAGESDLFPTGGYSENGRLLFYVETIGILLAILCIPASLKLFYYVLNRIDNSDVSVAVRKYVQWNIIRWGMLEAAVLFNLVCYYLTLSKTNGLCALMGLMAFLFCVPGKNKLLSELRIEND